MKKILPLAIALAALVGCASSEDSGQYVDDVVKAPEAPAGSLEALLQKGGIDAKSLGSFRPKDSPLVLVHNPGVLQAIVEVAPGGKPDHEFHPLAILERDLANPVAGKSKTLAAIPRFSCEAEAYLDAKGKPVADGLYTVAIDGNGFTEISDTVLAVAQALEEDGTAQAARVRDVEKKVSRAVFVPSRHLILYFGQDGAKAWKLHAADLTTPCDA